MTRREGVGREVIPQDDCVGRFLLLDVLGAGAMGIVRKAYDTALRREVALKFVPAATGASELAILQEAQAMAQLSHPNVVAVYDVIVDARQLVLAMEYVPGRTLATWLNAVNGRRKPWKDVLRAFVQAGRGLAAAHRVGLVHRDFKPGNVLVSDEGRVLVADFGLAVHRRGRDGADSICGTPRYMAPEQHRGEPADASTDQYAFCVALWEALCGEPPHDHRELAVLELAKELGPPSWPRHVRLPRQITIAVERGLASDRQQRWPTMEELLGDLESAMHARRNRAAVMWAAPALALTGVALRMHGVEHAEKCSGAANELRDVWNASRSHAIEVALLATGAPYAPQTWTRVQNGLSQYAEEWMTAHASSCEATVVTGVQPEAVMDLRMACLHRRKVALHSAVTLLAQADAEMVEKAVQLVSGLPSLSRCADVEALQAEVPPPESPREAAKVEEARVLLTRAAVAEQAGKYDVASEQVAAAEVVVEAVDHPPAHAEIAFRRGVLLDKQGQFEASELALERAMKLALTSGATEVAAQAASVLGLVVGNRQARPAEGIHLAKLAVALTQAQGNALELEAQMRNGLGGVLYAQGHLAEAAAEYRRALAVREQNLGPDDLGAIDMRYNLGIITHALGRYAEAEALHRQVLEVREQKLGSRHPAVAASRNVLAIDLLAQGRLDEAEIEFRSALELREETLGPEHPHVATSQNNLGIILFQQGRHEEAEVEYRRALALRVKTLGEEHPDVGATRINLGLALAALGRFAEAEAEYRQALALQEKALGQRHPQNGECRTDLGAVLHAQGRYEEAEKQHRAAIAIFEESLGPRHPHLAKARNQLALTLAARGRFDGAEAEYRRALALEDLLGPTDPEIEVARRGLTEALAALGKEARATERTRHLELRDQLWKHDARSPVDAHASE